MTQRRRNTFQTPRVTDAVTARRASQQASVGGVAGKGSKVDRTGRIGPDLGPEFFQDERGTWRPRSGTSIVWTPGSPPKPEVVTEALLSSDGSMGVDARGKFKAQPTAAQVRADELQTGIAGATVEAQLARVQINKASVAALDAVIAQLPIARGNVALVAGVATVPLDTIPAGALVMRQRNTLGGTVGREIGVSVSAGVSFTLTSLDDAGATQTLDTSTVDYLVFNP